MHEYVATVLEGTDAVAKGATTGSRDGKLFDFPSFEKKLMRASRVEQHVMSCAGFTLACIY